MAEALGAEYEVYKVTKEPWDAAETLFRGEPPLCFISGDCGHLRTSVPPAFCNSRLSTPSAGRSGT